LVADMVRTRSRNEEVPAIVTRVTERS